eukprot:CAMPEP_0113498148 /NCGR_PEP_ID=MMETSP0014_2-20120614/31002_1 /TAXON_ID=2857 /ORGANISM="Nitzschia sp." /LENGTH=486 /DNA_ID=CAMNT_0000392121 /DNA_START=116 /DNA_END=1576 /DNA_ORIENTATION=+ /assembly_acc=CAM_ASM_000159
MVFSWLLQSSSSAAAIAATKLDRMRDAERRLLEFARAYYYVPNSNNSDTSSSSFNIRTFDTPIPRSAVPLKETTTTKKNDDQDDTLTIHGVHVESKGSQPSASSSAPLVLLHGYMNAGSYFYRNFGGLAKYYQNIYAIDMLGWGLSSRPSFEEIDHTSNSTSSQIASATKEQQAITTAEDFFVESLEAWRSHHKIDKMVLCGHSFGGYMSVAYTERYPERVEKLVLLSPVGVPDESDPSVQERRKRFSSSFRGRLFFNVFQSVFESTTVGTILRNYMSEERSHGLAQSYVTRRLPQISDPEESKTVADYLYYNSMLSGSGEFFVHSILNGMVMARSPLHFRIPNLKVDSVTFLYGQVDWMDISGGLNTQTTCETINMNDDGHQAPDVEVYMVPNAGHLLMLENWEGTNNGIIHAASGGTISQSGAEGELPKLLRPTSTSNKSSSTVGDEPANDATTIDVDQLQNEWLQKTLESRKQQMVPVTGVAA